MSPQERVNTEDEEWLVEPVRKEIEVVEEFLKRLEEFKELKKVVGAKIDQVERWMRYRYRKQQELDMKESDAYRKLLSKLTGLDMGPGRRRAAYVEWGHANPELVDDLVRNHLSSKMDERVLRAAAIQEGWSAVLPEDQESWNEKALSRFKEDCEAGIVGASYPGYLLWAHRHSLEVDQRMKVAVTENAKACKYVKKGSDSYIAVRQEVVKREFSKLSKEDQQKWRDVAEVNHQNRVAEYNKLKAAPYSTAPEDRQKAIERLGVFMTPILEGVSEATGWNFSLFGGGPEPLDGGRLNTMALHVGVTAGPVPSTFGGLFRSQIKQSINKLFGAFLKKCFSVAECRSRALASTGLPRGVDEEDPTHTIVRDTIEDQGDRGEPSSSLPPTEKASAKQTVKPGPVPKPFQHPVAKPIQPTSTSSSASSSKSGTHARIRPPAGPPRLAPQGVSAPGAATKTAKSAPSGTGKSKEVARETVSKGSRPSTPISIHGSSPPSSPSIPPASLPPASPLSVRSSPAPEPEPVHQGSGAQASPINLFSSPPVPSPRTYKGRKRATSGSPAKAPSNSGSKHSTASSASASTSKGSRTRTSFVGVVIPVQPSSTSAKGRKRRLEDDDSSPSLSAPTKSSSSQPAPTSKRRKTTDSQVEDPVPEHVPHMVSSPAGCAEYAQTVLSICHEAQMDRQFRDVVVNWLHLDGKAKYTGPRLSATQRPPDIGAWIARARPVGFKPKQMHDLKNYADDFEAWYKNCSPSWRKGNANGIRLSRDAGEDWSSIAKFGPNGIVNFVVGLAWWKQELRKLPCRTPRERQAKAGHFALYTAALEEIDYTFRSLRDAGY
ncbi:SERTA domain-containing protein 3 [Paramarasmius palmivorus]|uniref:SERTA domain-containing protein 3 n=1 Tax=Paramarasmius palmivorus TaxID=297713 RepID=A0AAW0AXR3_9AGAR